MIAAAHFAKLKSITVVNFEEVAIGELMHHQVWTGCARAYSRKTKRISIPHGALGVAELITSRLVPYVGLIKEFC
ncbi:unnamed protein product [Arctia plantaginis]|uniref:Uncharacterized protein n=1 Tax=Arctia plantaginis TaxID=874455 RepID=A0A8S1BNW5_ARCPL|nr:unnamed protein product [Arctia plantaginis]